MAAPHMTFSPAELAYLHSSLSQRPPIRPDGRSTTQFRPLTAETGILPGTNSSASVCFADGTEAIVGVKAELETTALGPADGDDAALRARADWLELAIDIPGLRDDDPTTVFLAAILREALLADGELAKKLHINRRFHWRMYVDIVLISPPLSYPLPLLSLTTHLALLATRIPRLKSEGDEDPMFDDDWEVSNFLFPRRGDAAESRPPITLLVVSVGGNVIFDPAREELAVAEAALAVTVSEVRKMRAKDATDVDPGRELRLLCLRTIDPPSRLTPPGVSNSMTSGKNKSSELAALPPQQQQQPAHATLEQGVWRAPVGGIKFSVLDSIIQAALAKGGVADEILDGLEAIELA